MDRQYEDNYTADQDPTGSDEDGQIRGAAGGDDAGQLREYCASGWIYSSFKGHLGDCNQ
jgi:hypothetical protein